MSIYVGTKIVAQSPPGCIVPTTHPAGPTTSSTTSSSSSSATTPAAAVRAPKPCLFDFDVLQEYIIPRNSFFNRYMAVHAPGSKYAVLGFPVAIANPKYQRNEFIFNFGLVVESDVDQIPYERVVRRLAVTFAEMEKQNEYLSRDGGEGLAGGGGEGEGEGAGGGDEGELGGRRPIASLLEIIKEDLNNYGECMIPVGKSLPPSPHAYLFPNCYFFWFFFFYNVLSNTHTHRRRKHNQHEALPPPPRPARGEGLARPRGQDEVRRCGRPDVGPDAAKGDCAH